MDASSTIPTDLFDSLRMTLADSFDTYYAAGAGPRYSLISYSNIAKTEVLHCSTTAEMSDGLREMQHIGGGTWHRRALEAVKATFDKTQATYVLLFTDGRAS